MLCVVRATVTDMSEDGAHAEQHGTDADGRSQWQRMLDGDPYTATEPIFSESASRAALLAHTYHRLVMENPADPGARSTLKELFGQLGEGAVIRPPFQVDYGFHLSIGAGTFINFNLTALDVAPITIGQDCQIGPNVQLLAPTHPLEPAPRRAGVESGKPITLEDNVWLGGGVIVCPGVTIGQNSVVGAGAVVTKDVPPDVVVAGNPARIIRHL